MNALASSVIPSAYITWNSFAKNFSLLTMSIWYPRIQFVHDWQGNFLILL